MTRLAHGLPGVSVYASHGAQTIVRLFDEFVHIIGLRSKHEVRLSTGAIFGELSVVAGWKLKALCQCLGGRYEGFIELLRTRLLLGDSFCSVFTTDQSVEVIGSEATEHEHGENVHGEHQFE